jgi:AAA+ superfamily predicted ATPase
MASVPEFKDEVTAALKAHVPIVIVESYEWERVERLLCGITRKEGITYLKVTAERGLRLFDTDKKRFTSDDPMIADQHDWSIDNIVRWVRDELEGNVLLHIEDFHHNFQGEELTPGNHLDAGTQPHTASWAYVGYWRELARMKPTRGKTVLISGATQMAFGDLEKEVVSIKLDLPEVKELRVIYDRVLRQQGFDSCDDDERNRVVEAARGLTVMEAQTAFALAGLSNDRKLDKDAIPMIIRQKRSLLQNSGGLLDYFEPKVKIGDVGGLNNLKMWLEDRREALTPAARKFGIEAPKGLMLLGVPGCGKSLTAKAIASMWGYPLVRFDLSKVFGSYVGQTESQMRKALDVAEAVAPCILWIDEIEKGMAGAGGDGNTDSGVTARTFGILLTWMQEKTSPVFVVATSNRVQNLPAEAIRKGRFDEIFFVDLPSAAIREEILLKKIESIGSDSGTDASTINLEKIADETALFSGAELEQLVKDSLFLAYKDGTRPLTTEDLVTVSKRTYPLAITMREDISALRKFAHNRAQPADGEDIVTSAEDIPDEENPFGE